VSDPTLVKPLTPADVAMLLRSALTVIAAEGAALPDAVLRWRPAPGEWCMNEVLGHLIETEQRGFNGRIRIILGSDTPDLKSWNQEEVARARRDHERNWDELIAEFTRLREDSVSLVRGLSPADLPRAGRHPDVGMLRVGDLLHEWVHHDRNHIRQMMANMQAAAWPHMGNAQRF
jgi:DinB family protein